MLDVYAVRQEPWDVSFYKSKVDLKIFAVGFRGRIGGNKWKQRVHTGWHSTQREAMIELEIKMAMRDRGM